MLPGPACGLPVPTAGRSTQARWLPPASRQQPQALLSSCWAPPAWTCEAGAMGSSCVSQGGPLSPGTASGGARGGPLGRGGASSLQWVWAQRCTRAEPALSTLGVLSPSPTQGHARGWAEGPACPVPGGMWGEDGRRRGGRLELRLGSSGRASPGSVPDLGCSAGAAGEASHACACRELLTSQASRPGGTVPDSRRTSSVTPTSFLGSPASRSPLALRGAGCPGRAPRSG